MKINQIISETTTAGAIATVETSIGGTQSRGNPSIYGNKKVGSLFKGKKTKAPYVNSINESAEISEADLSEQDLIVVPGQGRSRKTGFVPHGQSRVDHEVEMARSDLFSAAKNAQQVYSMIKDVSEDEGLDGWVQEKIIKANDYLNTIREYLEGKQVQGVAEGANDVDSLVTDTEAVMKKFKIDATQIDATQALKALKIVLGEREYNDRPGYYNSFIRQIIARSKQQGVAEVQLTPIGQDDPERLEYLKKQADISRRTGLAVGDDVTLKDRPGFKGKIVKDWGGGDFSISGSGGGMSQSNNHRANARLIQKIQGVAEGSRNAYLKHNNLVDIEKPLAGLKSEFEKFLQTHDPKEKQKYQQGIKQRIKSEPMSGPKGVLPEQGVAEGKRNLKCVCKTHGTMQCPVHTPKDIEVIEGAKVDRMVKHVAQSEKKLGHSKKEAENIAWATANKRGMLNNKNKKA